MAGIGKNTDLPVPLCLLMMTAETSHHQEVPQRSWIERHLSYWSIVRVYWNVHIRALRCNLDVPRTFAELHQETMEGGDSSADDARSGWGYRLAGLNRKKARYRSNGSGWAVACDERQVLRGRDGSDLPCSTDREMWANGYSVRISDEGKGRASAIWNEIRFAGHMNGDLGELRQEGNCWINKRVRMCVNE